MYNIFHLISTVGSDIKCLPYIACKYFEKGIIFCYHHGDLQVGLFSYSLSELKERGQ